MKQTPITPQLYDYILSISVDEHPVLQALREETATMALAHMQISPEQGQFLQWLIRLIQGKKILELGTFTGYSALAMALAIPDDGTLITCDINSEWTAKTQTYWTAAHQDQKISLRLAPALQTLQQLVDDGHAHTFDFIFIDADKTNYIPYYEFALQLISANGIIAIDNIFWDGRVVDPNETGAQVREIRRLNQHIQQDKRVDASLLPIADGLFLVRPKT